MKTKTIAMMFGMLVVMLAAGACGVDVTIDAEPVTHAPGLGVPAPPAAPPIAVAQQADGSGVTVTSAPCATSADCPTPTDCSESACGSLATHGPCGSGESGCVCVTMPPQACVPVSCAPPAGASSPCITAADCGQPPAGSGWVTVCTGSGSCVREGVDGAACGGCQMPADMCPQSAIVLCDLDAPCPAPAPGCVTACVDGEEPPATIAWCCP